jgi:hypothetical protein
MKPIPYDQRIYDALAPLNPRPMKKRRLGISLLFSSDFFNSD